MKRIKVKNICSEKEIQSLKKQILLLKKLPALCNKMTKHSQSTLLHYSFVLVFFLLAPKNPANE